METSYCSMRSYAKKAHAHSETQSPDRAHVLAVAPLSPYSCRPSARRPDNRVIVIGAGMTGAMAAEELSAAGLRVTLVDRRGPLQGATSATTALLQYEIDTPLTVLQHTIGHADAARAWRRSAGLGKPGGESASAGHPVRLHTRLLALPGGDDAGCGRVGARMPGTQHDRTPHGVPNAQGLAGALRHQTRCSAAVL